MNKYKLTILLLILNLVMTTLIWYVLNFEFKINI